MMVFRMKVRPHHSSGNERPLHKIAHAKTIFKQVRTGGRFERYVEVKLELERIFRGFTQAN